LKKVYKEQVILTLEVGFVRMSLAQDLRWYQSLSIRPSHHIIHTPSQIVLKWGGVYGEKLKPQI